MKYSMILLVIIICSKNLYAQLSKTQRIQDSIIGWDAKNYYDRNFKAPTTEDGKQKLANISKIAEWLKASFTPVGGIGEYQRYIGTIGYGLDFQVWNVGYDYLDAQKNFKPIPEEFTPAHFAVNKLYNSYDIDFMNKKGEWFFTMQPNGWSPNSTEEKMRAGMNKTVDPNVSKYITWFGDWVTIYLAPNNQLPIKPVSKGELLDKAAASLDRVFEDAKKDEAQRWQGNTKGYDDAIAYVKKEIDKYRDNMQKLKEKYKNSLDEQAFVADMQTNWRSFTADSWDIFKKGSNTIYYPVYKLDATTLANMKDVQPQWLTIALPYAGKSSGSKEYEMYTAVTQNINYEYIYNYFFAPEKVKGITYKPVNEDQLKARLTAHKSANAINDATAAKKQSSLPANVVLFDDFESQSIGSKPGGWYSGDYDNPALVAKVDGMNGTWVKLGDRDLTSTMLKTFPQNFSLEFDVATDKFDANWGGSITLQLNGRTKGRDGVDHSSGFELSLTAGLQSALDEGHNYRGEIRMSLKNFPSKMDYNDQGGFFNFAQPFFTSSKRKVHIKIEKKDGDIVIYMNDKKIISSPEFQTLYKTKSCGDCTISPMIQYSKFTIANRSNDKATGVYLSNIKVMKL